ncbi:12391_t:CDS:2 [Dentiscutata heterogama]|uniref:12391_t:CDS:1 n=1 Tax=Dentiscutata heterogama TaxID=1316150 RepID=A0ACA9K8V9_9GLOM|nr:12391_t:CDS:2 [Dentiscutata heterogama]
MTKDKLVKKETKCSVLVNQNGKIEKCEEMFALLTSTSTLGAYLRTVYHLLEKEELLDFKELINLLKPFACITTLMGAEQMLTHQVICNVRDEIELNIGDRWEDPKIEGYLAAILDPRFKNLEFTPEKFEGLKNISDKRW